MSLFTEGTLAQDIEDVIRTHPDISLTEIVKALVQVLTWYAYSMEEPDD